MLDTMARQGEYSDYTRVAALDPATDTPPGAAPSETALSAGGQREHVAVVGAV